MPKEIQWKAYNYVGSIDPAIRYSFLFPYPGPYCEGCFDGWPYNNMPANVEGIWITGGYFDQPTKSAPDRAWSLTSGIVYMKDPETKNAELNTYLPSMIKDMLNTPIGGTAKITDSYNSYGKLAYKAKHIKDMSVDENTFSIYETTDENAQYYALLNKGDYVVVFSYTFDKPLYDVFEKILDTFEFKLVRNAAYGEPYQE